jgi:hypothetical protein
MSQRQSRGWSASVYLEREMGDDSLFSVMQFV